ncbi:MAG: hypothetical protein OEM38_09665 [Gammaproteobacteria bacterium]|nr:hypothetical protein [Gammaproteobacteria bacterium]
MKKIFIGVIYVLSIMQTGCNDSDNGDPQATLNTGIFIDSPVANLSYQTETQSGTTNSNGEFTYQDGETITFSIGALEFPVVTAADIITPITLAGSTSVTDQKATNIARLLQSLDQDGNPDNGIAIPTNSANIASSVNFDLDSTSFENNSAVINLIANSGSSNTTLVAATAAQEHVTSTLDNLITGVWRTKVGAGFIYLVTFKDNTFLYAESDLIPKFTEEDGLEVGTYNYESNSESITFNITYDDNAPGEDSGIGDIGVPVVISAKLADGNNTLNLGDGTILLSSVNFSSSLEIAGTWRSTNGAGFSYLVMFADKTFLYAENDLTVTTNGENGLEVGTYTYDSNSGNITFNIVYDDNAPGQDSGVGDIGTPVVMDAVLSNENNTLTIAGGAVILSKSL